MLSIVIIASPTSRIARLLVRTVLRPCRPVTFRFAAGDVDDGRTGPARPPGRARPARIRLRAATIVREGASPGHTELRRSLLNRSRSLCTLNSIAFPSSTKVKS